MKAARTLTVKNRVFGKTDIKSLTEVIDHQAKLATKSKHDSIVKYTFYFSDDTEYESDNIAIIDQSPLDSKRLTRCRFRFNNFSLDREIEIDLAHGEHSSAWSNRVTVGGAEVAWVNDNFFRLTEIVDAAKPQSRWIHRYMGLFIFLLSIAIGSLIETAMIVALVVLVKEPPVLEFETPHWLAELREKTPWVLYCVHWLFRWFIGLAFGSLRVYAWLAKAWPSIELDLGPDHLKREKIRRARVIAFVSLIVIPIALTVTLDLLT